MRARSIVPWLLLPPLAVAVAASIFVTRAVSSERHELARLAASTLLADSLDEATAWTAAEISGLAAHDAFTHVPAGLEIQVSTAETMREMLDGAELWTYLRSSDAAGARVLRRLEASTDVPGPVRTALLPMADDVWDRLEAGGTGFVDPEPYDEAAAWLQEQNLGSTARSEDAAVQLVERSDRPPFWRDDDFAGFTAVLFLLGVVGVVLAQVRIATVARRVHSALDEERARSAELHARSERLRVLLGLARRLTDGTDVETVAESLVAETRLLVGGEVVSLLLRDGERISPLVTDGSPPLAEVASGEGVVGLCVDGGMLVRLVVPSDPVLPGVDGPVSLLSAPLVAEGQVIGALVAASRTSELFDENDEAAFQVIALLAAGAVRAAQRLDSTVALAMRDPLTGLANRRRLDHDLAEAARTDTEVAFLMVDVDHFKDFNDRFGHPAGDQLLRSVAEAISASVREGDLVYRFGGEEFSVLLPGADRLEAAAVAERVRAAVAATLPPEGTSPVTVSVGVAAGLAAESPVRLVAAADQALYEAKRAGRNRVVAPAA